MSHHKRKKAKNQRAGSTMDHPHKMNGWSTDRLDVRRGFSNLRDRFHANADLTEFDRGLDRVE